LVLELDVDSVLDGKSSFNISPPFNCKDILIQLHTPAHPSRPPPFLTSLPSFPTTHRGFGGSPLGVLGLGFGGGCGVGIGLGWGLGVGLGSQYINVSPEFAEGKTHRPNPIQQVKYAIKRFTTLTAKPIPTIGGHSKKE
jgi:hypothetical protein